MAIDHEGRDPTAGRESGVTAATGAAEGSPGIPTRIVPPPEAATGASRSPLATSSLVGGVVRKICWSNPTMIPPIDCPTDPVFFFVTREV
jgi:hypothetical protein